MSNEEQNAVVPDHSEFPKQVRDPEPTRVESDAVHVKLQTSRNAPGVVGVDDPEHTTDPWSGLGRPGHETNSHTGSVPDQVDPTPRP